MPMLTLGADLIAVDLVRLATASMMRLAKASSAARDFDRRHDDREFVAAEPRQQFDCRQRPLQPLGDFLQQQVADAMPERVVDDLEAVEIEEQDGEFASGRRRPATPCRRHRSSSVERKTRRFGRPVSGSSDASRATWASASRRLVMSVKVCTKLPSGRWPLRTSMTLPFGIVRSRDRELLCRGCSRPGARLSAVDRSILRPRIRDLAP